MPRITINPTVERMPGCLFLTVVADDTYYRRRYIGFSRSDAVKDFKRRVRQALKDGTDILDY